MPPTRKAYRRSDRRPSGNFRPLDFPVNPQNPKHYCLLCGNTGWRYPYNNQLLGVVVCVCRGERRDVQPAGDFKSSAAGDR